MLYKDIEDNTNKPSMTKQMRERERSQCVKKGSKMGREEWGGKAGEARRGPQGRLAMSLSGGGPTGLGLLSLAFPSNIMTSLRTADRFPSIMFTKSR